MEGYTDYCTCIYVREENKVYFYDEIKECTIKKQSVEDEKEAAAVMQRWQNNAPARTICQMLN